MNLTPVVTACAVIAVASAGCTTTEVPRDAALDALDAPDTSDALDTSDTPDAPDTSAPVLVPQIDGPWWQVAGNPDLGDLTSPGQQPVDFGVWQAPDGTWQLWSCIRFTRCGTGTRVFHRWEGARLTDTDWRPMGIVMQADPTLGETACGIQAPYAFRAADNDWRMVYGDWEHICESSGRDGKSFTRILDASGRSGMFAEAPNANTRDPMVLRVGDLWHLYYTAGPGGRGSVYVRTSRDLRTWSDSRVVAAGGAAGAGPYSAECPFVVHRADTGFYYLFRTQQYGATAQTTVYRSADPTDFGVDDDRYRVGTLPVAAPEVFDVDGQSYLAALRPTLDGIQIARLRWVPRPTP